MLSLRKTPVSYDHCIRMSVLGNALGNSIVGKINEPKLEEVKVTAKRSGRPMDEIDATMDKIDALINTPLGKNPDTDYTPGLVNPDQLKQMLASADRAQAEADQFTTQLADAGKSPQFAALDMSEFVAQAQSLSDKLHVQPGFMKNSYDTAMSEASNPNNSWIGQKLNLAGATLMFPTMVAEEFGRGLMNIPSGVAGAIPAADRLGQDFGAMLDTSLTTSDRFIAGGNALINFSAGFTGLGAPAAFFTGSLATAPLTAEQRGLQGFMGRDVAEEGSAKFLSQGFSPAQAEYLAAPYEGMGHHFIPRRAGLPEFISDSPINVLKPSGMSRGDFYALHYKVDQSFYGTAFPKSIGGTWSGRSLGLEKYSGTQRLWYASPTPLKVTIGGAAAAGAAGGYLYYGNDK